MNAAGQPGSGLARNVRRLGHLDLAGGGQVTIRGSHAFVGHIPNPDHLGTSIIDIADPRQPRVVATIALDDHESHSNKVRVVGDIMIVNHERNMSKIGRRAEQLPAARRALTEELAREPTRSEIAAKMRVTEDDLAALEKFEQRRYANGGFKIYDVSDPSQPELICYQKTGGIGVHRFDMDERHAYISTEMEGYVGNILAIYDLRARANRRKFRGGGCRGSTSRAARRRLGPAGGTVFTMRCALVTRCGRAAGTPASGWSTSPI